MIILTAERADRVRGRSPTQPWHALEPVALNDGTFGLPEDVVDNPANADVLSCLTGLPTDITPISGATPRWNTGVERDPAFPKLGDDSATIADGATGTCFAFPGIDRFSDDARICAYDKGAELQDPEGVIAFKIRTGETWGSEQTAVEPTATLSVNLNEITVLPDNIVVINGRETVKSNLHGKTFFLFGDYNPADHTITWDDFADRITITIPAFKNGENFSASKIIREADGTLRISVYGLLLAAGLGEWSAGIISSPGVRQPWGDFTLIAESDGVNAFSEANGFVDENDGLTFILRQDTSEEASGLGYARVHAAAAPRVSWSAPGNVISQVGSPSGKPAIYYMGNGLLMLFARFAGSPNAGYTVSENYGLTFRDVIKFGSSDQSPFWYASPCNTGDGGVTYAIARGTPASGADANIVYQEFRLGAVGGC